MATDPSARVVPCPHCHAQQLLPAEAEPGSTVRCPACDISFEVSASRIITLPTATLIPPQPEAPKPEPPLTPPLTPPPLTTDAKPLGVFGDFLTTDAQEPASLEATSEDAASEDAPQTMPSLSDLMKSTAPAEKTPAEKTPAEKMTAETTSPKTAEALEERTPAPIEAEAPEKPAAATEATRDAEPAPAEPPATPQRDPQLDSLLDQLRGIKPPEMPDALPETPRGTPRDEPPVGAETVSETVAETPNADIPNAEASQAKEPAATIHMDGVTLDLDRPPVFTDKPASPAAEAAPLARDFGADFQSPAIEEEPQVERQPEPVAAYDDEPDAGSSWGVGRLATVSTVGVAALGLGYAMMVALGGPGYDSLGVLAMTGGGPPRDTTAGAAPAETQPSDDLAPPAPFEPDSAGTPLGQAPTEGGPEQASFVSPSDTPAPVALPVELPAAEPPAAEPSPPAEPPQDAGPAIAGAPVYSVDDLKAALAGADQARADLAAHSLAKGEQVELIGRSYAKLCEVAQVLAFADGDRSHPDMMITRLEAQNLYKQLFRSAHARDDARLVATRWINWQERPHGGVFFSGMPTGAGIKGSVYEYELELGDGAKAVVLSEQPIRVKRFLGAEAIGVVGCMIEAPADKVTGYTGDAPRAVWVAHTIPLYAADLD